ncbi:MAG TPA: 2-phosphosulfolactate phosphatase [Ktedonobacteraceae bacterium]|jgi:2-phosphosulfolactate phosphatase
MQDAVLIHRIEHQREEQARGIVIVIDVIRAFTVAAYALAGGASGLWLVRTVEQALALREYAPGALLAGEINGRLIPGFDLNNSPHKMALADVRGRCIIQRTGAGTQGAVRACNATHLLVASLTNARVTAAYAAALGRETGLPIALVPTEATSGTFLRNEDRYCCDYIETLILQPGHAPEVLRDRLARLHAEGRFHRGGKEADADFPHGDIARILAVDCFNFVMVGTHREYRGFSYVEVAAKEVPPASPAGF